jgi:hypothetical protein
MPRVLMISYYFPPLGGMGSVRSAKFATYLPRFGWEAVVVAPLSGASYEDRSLHVPGARVYRTRNLQLGRLLTRVRSVDTGPSGDTGDRVRQRVRSFVHRWLYRPDGQVGWYPFAVRAAREAIRDGRCDVIFSSSFPITAHLVARRLHRETGVPWVAEFRDLWTDRGASSPRRQRVDETMEHSILKEATEMVTVSPAFADALLARGAPRVAVVTNGFDPADFSRLKSPEPDETIITYLGTYYPGRQDLGTAVRAIGSLAREGALPRLRLRFVGKMPGSLRGVIVESGLGSAVEDTGFVSHEESLRYICGSTLLLLAGVTSEGTNAVRGVIPGKTFEYLGAGRPILFVSHSDGDAAKLLSMLTSVKIVRPGDVEGARAAVLSLLEQGASPRPSLVQRYTSQSVTGDLARVLDRARLGCRESAAKTLREKPAVSNPGPHSLPLLCEAAAG